MMTSGDVGGLFANQNQAFAGQADFASRIGMAPPSFGLAAYGAPQNAPGGFNYGGQGMFSSGFGSGSKFAGTAMAGIGGAATVAGAGLGVATMFGKMGGLAPIVDPFSAFSAARAAGAGIMGGLGAAAAPLALGMAASHAVGSFVQGGMQQQQLNSTLGQNYNFFNPQSRTGGGFTRDDAQAIGSVTRQMANIPEMMTSMNELTSIMGRLKGTGIMQGVKDAQEFSKRFKEAITTIRSVAETLGTTMSEATQFFAHSESVGMGGKSAALKNALNAQLTSGLTGMSMGQVMQMQTTGANMATQMGAQRRFGTTAVTNIAQAIGTAQRRGGVSNELIQNISGLEGAEGVQSVSEHLAGAMMQMGQGTSAGRLIMAGLTKFDESGKAIGLDQDLVKQFNSGGFSRGALESRARGMTQRQRLSFSTRTEDLSADFAGSVGPGGMARFMGEIAGGRFGDEGTVNLLKRYGLNTGEADLAMKMGAGGGSSGDLEQMAQIRGRESELRSKTDPSAIMKRIKSRIHAATFGKAEELGSKVFGQIGEAYDDFIDDLVGRHIVTLSKQGADDFVRMMASGGKKEIKKLFEDSTGASPEKMRQMSMQNRVTTGKMIAAGLTALTGGAASYGMTADFLDNHGFGGNLRDSDPVRAAYSIAGEGGFGGYSETGKTEKMQGLLGTSDEGEFRKRKEFLNSGMGELGRGLGDYVENVRDEMGAGYFNGPKFTDIKDDFDKAGRLRKDLVEKISYGLGGTNERATQILSGVPSSSAQKAINGDNDSFLNDYSEEELKKLTEDEDDQRREAAKAMLNIKRMKAVAPKGMDAVTAYMAASLSGQSGKDQGIDWANTSGNVADFANVEYASARMKEARDSMKSAKFSDATQNLIENNPEMRGILTKALGGGKGGDAIRDALTDKDPNSSAAKLARLGIKVKPEDIAQLKAAYYDVKDKNKEGEALSSITTFENAVKGKDRAVILSAFRELSADLSNTASTKSAISGDLQGIADKLSDLSKGGDSKTVMGAYDAAQGAIGDLITKVSGMSGKDQASAISGAGRLSSALGKAVDVGGRLKKFEGRSTSINSILGASGLADNEESRKEISEALGKDWKDGKSKFSHDMLVALQKKVGLGQAAKDMASEGKSAAAGQDPTVRALEAIAANQNLTATILVAIAKKSGAAGDEFDAKIKAAGVGKEQAGAGPGGATQPGH